MPFDDPRPFSFVEEEFADQLAGAENAIDVVDNFEPAGDDELSDFENFATDDEEDDQPDGGNDRRHPRPPNTDYLPVRQEPPEENQQQQQPEVANHEPTDNAEPGPSDQADSGDERPVNRHGRRVTRPHEVRVHWIQVEDIIFSTEEEEEFSRRRSDQHPESNVLPIENLPEDDNVFIQNTTTEAAATAATSSNDNNQHQPDVNNIPAGPSTSNEDDNRSASQSPESKLKIDGDKVEVIKNLMSGFKLPTESIPAWANEVSEEKWKQLLHDKLNKSPEK